MNGQRAISDLAKLAYNKMSLSIVAKTLMLGCAALFSIVEPTAGGEAKPRFHCYTYPKAVTAAYITQTRSGGGQEIVCTYSAGCKPADSNGPPPHIDDKDLKTMFTNGTLKGSFLICRGSGTIKDNQITTATCPPANACLTNGFFNGVIAGESKGTVPVATSGR